MENLRKHNKKPCYPNIHTNVNGYHGIECKYTFNKVPTLVTKKTQNELEKIFLMYKTQTNRFFRRCNAFILRIPMFGKCSEKTLEDSRILWVYSNGFAVAYRYFFYDKTCFMTSKSAVEDQVQAYLNSSRVPALLFKPDNATKNIDTFISYAFDLGQKAAAEYAIDVMIHSNKKYSDAKNLSDYLCVSSKIDASEKYVEKYIANSLRYIQKNEKNVAKRIATVIKDIQTNSFISINDNSINKNDRPVTEHLIILFTSSLDEKYRQKSLSEGIRKYLNPNESRNISSCDIKELKSYLESSN